jgi:hypothetical protein
MNNANDEKEVAIIQEPVAVPPQASPTDTSNQDNKVSVDPSGERYIRTVNEKDLT